jgi:hypothetical protein
MYGRISPFEEKKTRSICARACSYSEYHRLTCQFVIPLTNRGQVEPHLHRTTRLCLRRDGYRLQMKVYSLNPQEHSNRQTSHRRGGREK